ncbi:MAG: flavin reductase family protein [Ilumatobacteraceae bacterium]
MSSIELRPDELPVRDVYRLLTGVIVPRPVAWITTLSPTGAVNLAPFSAFTLVSPSPPMVGFTVGPAKDTCRHVEARQEFVVNIPSFTHVDDVHDSSIEHPPEISELDELGLTTVASSRITTPRLAGTAIQLECEVRAIHHHGNFATRFVVGEIVAFHIDAELLLRNSGGIAVDVVGLDPIGVLTGGQYSRLGDITSRQPAHGARNPWGMSYPERATAGPPDPTAVDGIVAAT